PDAEAAQIDGRSGSGAAGGSRRSRSDRNPLPWRRCVFRSRQCRKNPRHRRRRGDRSRHQSVQAETQARKISRYALWPRPPRHDRGQYRRFDRSLREGECDARSHGHASYPGLTDYRHDPRVVGKMAGHVVLPWIHRVFALLKRWSLGTYHGLRRKHVDTYLNEFVFRYNRRFYRHVSFETVLGLTARHKPTGYWDIIGRANPRKGNATLRRATRRR